MCPVREVTWVRAIEDAVRRRTPNADPRGDRAGRRRRRVQLLHGVPERHSLAGAAGAKQARHQPHRASGRDEAVGRFLIERALTRRIASWGRPETLAWCRYTRPDVSICVVSIAIPPHLPTNAGCWIKNCCSAR